MRPLLQLRFARDGILHVTVMLVVKQLAAAIGRGEPSDVSRAMLAYSSCKIIRHADIEDGIVDVCHDVDPKIVIARHWREDSEIPRLRSE